MAKDCTERSQLGTIYSNLDHVLEPGAEVAMRETGVGGTHTAWDHCGYIWYDEDRKLFIESVWVYHVEQERVEHVSLVECIKQVNEKYGQD